MPRALLITEQRRGARSVFCTFLVGAECGLSRGSANGRTSHELLKGFVPSHVFVFFFFSLVEKLTVGERVLRLKKKIYLYHCENDKNCHLMGRHLGARL